MDKGNILEIRDLRVNLMTVNGILYALQGVNLDLKSGEIHGIVGESGCGKSMTVKSVMKLHDPRRTEYGGEIRYGEKSLLNCTEKEMRSIWGSEISMIFQDPAISLDPIMKVGQQIMEMIQKKENASKEEARDRVTELFRNVGIEPAEKRMEQYPFQMSGGLLQRIMICMALACHPRILIADEPTTALDVTIQAQILKLLKRLQKDTEMSVLFVTHNLGVVAEVCDRVSVMYGGKIMETADVVELFDHPLHPYTKALLDSSPNNGNRGERMSTIPGEIPKLYRELCGCPFAPRCDFATELCFEKIPESRKAAEGHTVACHLAGEFMMQPGSRGRTAEKIAADRR